MAETCMPESLVRWSPRELVKARWFSVDRPVVRPTVAEGAFGMIGWGDSMTFRF